MSKIAPYTSLMCEYSCQKIDVLTFQTKYMEMFQMENETFPPDVFEALDSMFSALDSFTEDSDLLKEKPGFYLDEAQLRQETGKLLKKLGVSPSAIFNEKRPHQVFRSSQG